MSQIKFQQLIDGLYRFEDTCNVYVLRRGDRALAIDYGSGRWRSQLSGLGIRKLEQVILTHHHADQCAGLQKAARRPFEVHAPQGERQFLEPERVAEFWKRRRPCSGFPSSYSVVTRGVRGVLYDLADGGPGEQFWGPMRIRFIATPGHGPNALSAILDWQGRQIVFCGDAAHAGATIWQPYHLEWHHSRIMGHLAAWEGVTRLSEIRVDLLCPSHGPAVAERPRSVLKRLARKIMALIAAKGCICPGEPDGYVPAEPLGPRIRKILPHLFQFGMNGYLLLSEAGEALIVDPQIVAMPFLDDLRARLGNPRITAALASHYHHDHTDGLPMLRKRHGARLCLHPSVAGAIEDRKRYDLPYLPSENIRADTLLPERGSWRWNEYVFQVAPFPGQTWWHAAHQTEIDGVKVFFGGDSFQPASRWGGGGGFCSLNDSRFRNGFYKSAQLVLDWSPDILCNGHGTFFRFRPSQFRKIQKWAPRAERAVADLCPSGDLERDYCLHHTGR